MEEIKGLIIELGGLCDDNMPERLYSNTSKYPYKLMYFLNALNLRMKECSQSAVILLEIELTLPALVLIRTMMENTALLYDAYKLVKTTIDSDEFNKGTDAKLMQLLFANQYPKESCEFSDLEMRATRIGALNSQVDVEFPGWKEYYGKLCEFVHPNSDGVICSYSELIEKEGILFKPQLTEKHCLYKAFLATLKLSLAIYIEKANYIKEEIYQFSNLSEAYIENRN